MWMRVWVWVWVWVCVVCVCVCLYVECVYLCLWMVAYLCVCVCVVLTVPCVLLKVSTCFGDGFGLLLLRRFGDALPVSDFGEFGLEVGPLGDGGIQLYYGGWLFDQAGQVKE